MYCKHSYMCNKMFCSNTQAENCKLKEYKMTREEALAKLKRLELYNEGSSKHWLLDQLETIGLIKFDEEPAKREITIHDAIKFSRSSTTGTGEFMDALDKFGYKIVKK